MLNLFCGFFEIKDIILNLSLQNYNIERKKPRKNSISCNLFLQKTKKRLFFLSVCIKSG